MYEQSANNPNASLLCKVCQTPYQVEKKQRIWSQLNVAITPRHWIQTVALVIIMCGAIAGASVVIQYYHDSGIRMLAVGVALLIVYVCFR
jgi:von Hippel-Lindau disease tumor supressor